METLAPERPAAPSAHERTRGKPAPGRNHSIGPANTIFELKTRYRDQFRFLSEINVEIGGRVLVPDIGIFPAMPLNMAHDVQVLTRLPLTTI